MKQDTKRFRAIVEPSRERQLSGLFSIIGNNLLVAVEILSQEYDINAIHELEVLSHKARTLANELNSNSISLSDDEIIGRVSSLKHRMLELIIDLSEELTHQISSGKAGKKAIQSIIVARRLLRDSRRGLATIRD